jgi:hypothetical protein
MQPKNIGWDQWIYGRMTKEWGIIQNHDIKSKDSGTKFNTSKKWAKTIILLSWNFAYDIWSEKTNQT